MMSTFLSSLNTSHRCQQSAPLSQCEKVVRIATQWFLTRDRQLILPLVFGAGTLLWHLTPISSWLKNIMIATKPLNADEELQWRYMEKHGGPGPVANPGNQASSEIVSDIGHALELSLQSWNQKLAVTYVQWKFTTVRDHRLGVWALPGGEVVVSDALVEVVDHHELGSLMACAMGDILHRHSRQLHTERDCSCICLCYMTCILGVTLPLRMRSFGIVVVAGITYWIFAMSKYHAVDHRHVRNAVSFAHKLIKDHGNDFSEHSLYEAAETLKETDLSIASTPIAQWIAIVEDYRSEGAIGRMQWK